MTDHHRSPEWKKLMRVVRPQLAAALPLPCIHCPMPVNPGDAFDVSHIVSVDEAKTRGWSQAQTDERSNLGVAHARCNRSDGGRVGAAKGRASQRSSARLPNW